MTLSKAKICFHVSEYSVLETLHVVLEQSCVQKKTPKPPCSMWAVRVEGDVWMRIQNRTVYLIKSNLREDTQLTFTRFSMWLLPFALAKKKQKRKLSKVPSFCQEAF